MPARGDLKQVRLPCQTISAEAFRPFGDLIEPTGDGRPFGPDDADLELGRGRPRLYIMTLESRGLAFAAITRHRLVTQCLAAMGGMDWLLAVAPPGDPDDPDGRPDPRAIAAFRIPGSVAIKPHRGTWHAGPYFTAPQVDFLNLELSDTNQADHDTCHLDRAFGIRMTLVP